MSFQFNHWPQRRRRWWISSEDVLLGKYRVLWEGVRCSSYIGNFIFSVAVSSVPWFFNRWSLSMIMITATVPEIVDKLWFAKVKSTSRLAFRKHLFRQAILSVLPWLSRSDPPPTRRSHQIFVTPLSIGSCARYSMPSEIIPWHKHFHVHDLRLLSLLISNGLNCLGFILSLFEWTRLLSFCYVTHLMDFTWLSFCRSFT